MTTRTTAHTNDEQQREDERVARAKLGRLVGDLQRTVDAFQALDGDEGPRFLRYIAAEAQVMVLENTLVALMATDGDRGVDVARAYIDERLMPAFERLQSSVERYGGGSTQVH